MKIAAFGRVDGNATTCFTLENSQLRIKITDFGARIVAIEAPDRAGRFGHVLLGFENAEAYVEAGGSFGAILGRYANRIANGRFTLDGRDYQLAVNDAGNTLHGGPKGFGSALWKVKKYDGSIPELVLTHLSPEGDQGFPGNISVSVTYRLAANTLQIRLMAMTDQPTIVNLSSHPYFNLVGNFQNDCLSHDISINADRFLPTDQQQIPTGELESVDGSVFDFRERKKLGVDIRQANEQLLIARGYDHCFVLNCSGDSQKRFAASASDSVSGRMLELFTDQPGLQLYSGNSLDGSIIGRGGVALRQSAGFAFEAQNFPDAANHASFPSSILRPDQVYRRLIDYAFSIQDS